MSKDKFEGLLEEVNDFRGRNGLHSNEMLGLILRLYIKLLDASLPVQERLERYRSTIEVLSTNRDLLLNSLG